MFRWVFIGIIFLVLSACNLNDGESGDVKEIASDHIIKRTTLKGKEAIEIGDLILGDQLYFFDIWEPVKYDTLDWEMDPYDDPSWVLYNQSLRPVSFLCNAYEETGDPVYLEKAKAMVSDWIENHDPNNPEMWYVQRTSSRMLNFTYLLEMLKIEGDDDEEFYQSVVNTFPDHAEVLMDDDGYRWSNHGIMQDRALIQMALLHPDVEGSEEWLQKGLSRLNQRLDSDKYISSEGVNKEHAPNYHYLVLLMLYETQQLLEYHGHTLDHLDKLEQMKEHLAYVLKPEGKYPIISDSTNDVHMDVEDDFENEYLKYVLTQGEEGEKPEQVSMVYEDAGVAIFRDEWKTGNNFKDSTYFYFHAGFHNMTHKHADDLSFVLYALGEDIFVNSGKYSYKDPGMRDYFISSLSKNTVSVNGKSYELNEEDATGGFITDWSAGDEYDWVRGQHDLYGHTTITRDVVFIKPNVIIIVDRMDSDKKNTYQQVFNIAPNLENIEYNERGFTAESSKSDLKVKLTQLKDIKDINVYNDQDDPIRGYVSLYTDELIETDQVEFVTEGADEQFLTLVKLESDKFEPVTDVSVNGETKITYKKSGKQKEITIK